MKQQAFLLCSAENVCCNLAFKLLSIMGRIDASPNESQTATHYIHKHTADMAEGSATSGEVKREAAKTTPKDEFCIPTCRNE